MVLAPARRVVPSIEVLNGVLARCWSSETSYDPSGWSVDNPAWGHCAVTALLVQDFHGGKLLLGAINGIEHYWNQLPNLQELDLTRVQFQNVQSVSDGTVVSRDFVLSFPDTNRRYTRLRELALSELHEAVRS